MRRIDIILTACLAAVACTNLDEQVFSETLKSDFFTSEEMLSIYSARAYTSLQAWGTEQSMLTLNMQLSNEVCVPVNSVGEWKNPRYPELQTHEIPTTNKLSMMGWDFCFDGIAACNDVLYEINRFGGDFDGKKRIVAEISVLRAFYYMMAIDGWGDVPFSLSPAEKELPKVKSRAEVFKFIQDEVTQYLPDLADGGTIEYYGRVTKDMAHMLLAKLYINAKEWIGTEMWAEAEAEAGAVINGGHFQLATNYKDNFRVHNEGSPEAVFAIPYSTVYTESDHRSFVLFIMTLDGPLSKAFNIGGAGWDGFVGQPDFIASYDPADQRLHDTWLVGQVYDSSGKKVTYQTSESSPKQDYIIDPDMDESMYTNGRPMLKGARISKWEFQNDGKIKDDQTSMENDFILFRYADAVLLYVEALVRQDRAAEAAALPDFQGIRTRAGLAPMTASDLTLDNLLLERQHELACEGWSRQDLIRFGKYLDAWWAKPAGQDYMQLLPIPEDRRKANPNLGQNPGY